MDHYGTGPLIPTTHIPTRITDTGDNQWGRGFESSSSGGCGGCGWGPEASGHTSHRHTQQRSSIMLQLQPGTVLKMDRHLLARATSSDDTPTPGYMYGEIAK